MKNKISKFELIEQVYYWQDMEKKYYGKYIDWMSFGMVMLIIVVILLSVIYFTNVKSQPTYHIYLNECKNVTGEYSGYLCNDGTAILDYTNYDSVTIGNKTCKAHYGNWTREVCNKTEVKSLCYTPTNDCVDITQDWLRQKCEYIGKYPGQNEPMKDDYKCGDNYEVTN